MKTLKRFSTSIYIPRVTDAPEGSKRQNAASVFFSVSYLVSSSEEANLHSELQATHEMALFLFPAARPIAPFLRCFQDVSEIQLSHADPSGASQNRKNSTV